MFCSNEDIFSGLKLFFNHLEKVMALLALQSQHDACFKTGEDRQAKSFFIHNLYLILCASLQSDFLVLSKIQLNNQGVAYNPVPRIENIDSTTF